MIIHLFEKNEHQAFICFLFWRLCWLDERELNVAFVFDRCAFTRWCCTVYTYTLAHVHLHLLKFDLHTIRCYSLLCAVHKNSRHRYHKLAVHWLHLAEAKVPTSNQHSFVFVSIIIENIFWNCFSSWKFCTQSSIYGFFWIFLHLSVGGLNSLELNTVCSHRRKKAHGINNIYSGTFYFVDWIELNVYF